MERMKTPALVGLCLAALLASGCDDGGGGDGGQDGSEDGLADAADGQDDGTTDGAGGDAEDDDAVADGADEGVDDGEAEDGGDDGAAEDGADGGVDDDGAADDDGAPQPQGCAFPYSAPRWHPVVDPMGGSSQAPDRHILCTLDHEGLHAHVLMKAEPTAYNGWDLGYQAWRAFLCRDGQVSELPAADIGYEARHHGWDVLQVVVDGRRYVYRWSEACVGYRPCTPSFDCFDVRDQATSTLLASMVPATCVELGTSGKPLPLTPLVRVPASGPEPYALLVYPMGSAGGAADEQPVHEVAVTAQRMDAREATWADIALFLDDHGPDCDGAPCLDLTARDVGVELVGGSYQPRAGREDEPAGYVSWAGADAYCMWRNLSLPTEADWELAASAAGTRTYPWGAEAPTCERAVFADCQVPGPSPACSAPGGESAEGVCDLAGNLAEWVRDWYAADFYADCLPTPCDQPSGPADPTGERVLRGGAFDSPAAALRAAARGHAPPGTAVARVGVRCARSTYLWAEVGPDP